MTSNMSSVFLKDRTHYEARSTAVSRIVMIKVLFVCLGNICRSPTAEGVFRGHLAQNRLDNLVIVDSAGTGDWHIGNPPDVRAQQAALHRGIELSDLRARQVCFDDFSSFDYIVAMDRSNLEDLRRVSDSEHHHKIHLFMEFTDRFEATEVPDPYYGGERGFDIVLDMIDAASTGLLCEIRKIHLGEN